MRKPAAMPLKNISSQECPRICRLISTMPFSSSGESTGVNVENSAANSVPAKLASSTTAHMRAILARFGVLNVAMTGKTAVIVFSVKSCCRDMITMTKPTV